jgi:hypothetical protein
MDETAAAIPFAAAVCVDARLLRIQVKETIIRPAGGQGPSSSVR